MVRAVKAHTTSHKILLVLASLAQMLVWIEETEVSDCARLAAGLSLLSPSSLRSSAGGAQSRNLGVWSIPSSHAETAAFVQNWPALCWQCSTKQHPLVAGTHRTGVPKLVHWLAVVADQMCPLI